MGGGARKGSARRLLRGAGLEDCVDRTGRGFDLVSSSMDLAGDTLDSWVSPQTLGSRLRASGYDYVVVDTATGLWPATLEALGASNGVVVPVHTEYLGLAGAAEFLTAIKGGPAVVVGVVVTMLDRRTRSGRLVVDDLRRTLGPTLFTTVVPRSAAVVNAVARGGPVTKVYPKSPAAAAYSALTDEFLGRVERLGP